MKSIREGTDWRTENHRVSQPEWIPCALATSRLQKQYRCYERQLLESPPLSWFDLTGQAREGVGQLESVFQATENSVLFSFSVLRHGGQQPALQGVLMAGEGGVTFSTQQKRGSPQDPSDCAAYWDGYVMAASLLDEGGLSQEMKERKFGRPRDAGQHFHRGSLWFCALCSCKLWGLTPSSRAGLPLAARPKFLVTQEPYSLNQGTP